MTLLSAGVRARVDDALGSGVPGLVLAAARGAAAPELLAVGTDRDGRILTSDTLFPVASITKLATSLCVLRLVDNGALSLDEPLVRYLPDAVAAEQPRVTLRSLLGHTSGLAIDLAPGEAPYGPGLDWPALGRACLRAPIEAPPGTRVQYSNVGYGLLALAVERVVRRAFREVLRELVVEPLGVEAYLGDEPPRPPARHADVRGSSAGTDVEVYGTPFWRGLAVPWGGMVATVGAALAFLRAFTGWPVDLLRPETRRAATSSQTGDLAGGFLPPLAWSRGLWGLGPELRGDKSPHWAPASASPASFGHAGASGAFAWYDPAVDLAWALVGTRTAENGWLLRRGAAIGAALLAAADAG